MPGRRVVLDGDVAAVVVGDERGDVVGLEPRHAELGGDLRRGQRRRLHGPQGVDVAVEAGVGRGGGDGLVELADDVTGEVVGGELPLPCRGLERHLGQLRLGGRCVDGELVGDVAGVDAVPAGERVGDGLLDRVGPIRPRLAGRLEDRALQDRRRGRLAGVVVEHLERGDGPPRRVGAEPLQLRVAPPDLGPLPGRLVDRRRRRRRRGVGPA